MLLIRLALGAVLLAGIATAQEEPAKASDMVEAQRHFELSATRAVANLRSLESIEAVLQMRGMALHPRLVALRLRIEAALDKAESAIERDDAAAAEEQARRADGYLDRLEAQLGV